MSAGRLEDKAGTQKVMSQKCIVIFATTYSYC